jgi:predicted ArsR family transcriptional regulator
MTEHRALADPSRVRLLERLRAAGRPQAVSDLAGPLGLHPNTVRAHVGVLERAGLVVSEVERSNRVGRPRLLFAAVPESAEQEHELLAAALASSLEPLPEGGELALEAGRGWGRVLVERLEPGVAPGKDVCVERVARLLRLRGFAPSVAPGELVMHRCPFRDLAERYPRVVCALHAGLIDGALEELRAPVQLRDLEAWNTPSTCIAHLGPRGSA